MANDLSDWARDFEKKLNERAPTMQSATALIEQEGFRVDSGNKSPTDWFLTAYDKDSRRGNIKVQYDGTKIVVTVVG
jgi:hypothetical protein